MCCCELTENNGAVLHKFMIGDPGEIVERKQDKTDEYRCFPGFVNFHLHRSIPPFHRPPILTNLL